MFRDNIVMLRNMRGWSQEKTAEMIGISRQAYAKWESGSSVPDIEKCALLASVYGVSIDSLIRGESVDGIGTLPPAPQGKNIWGSVILSERGQVVIPKEAREKLGFEGGTRLIVLSDENGIALVSAARFEAQMKAAMELASRDSRD